MTEIRVREAMPDDADVVARMAAALAAHEGKRSIAWTADDFRRDGFGPDAAFSTLVAETGGSVVGYALFHPGYDTETASRGVHLVDLFVVGTARRRGVGRALLDAVVAACRAGGGRWIAWFVEPDNREGSEFYRAIGARKDPGIPFWIEAETLRASLARRRAPADGDA